jgi:hypothetical protein
MYAKATLGGRTIAETDKYEVVEGNVYVCRFLELLLLGMMIV